jgi:DNA-binding NtrC family response regulator
MQHLAVVAIIHADEAVRTALASAFEEQGYRAVTAPLAELVETPEEAIGMLRLHDPSVIVYDVSPYDESVPFLAFLCGTQAARGRSFVLTTTAAHENTPLLAEAIDLRSCPHAVDDLLGAVERLCRSSNA